jgi:hypothetical protein
MTLRELSLKISSLPSRAPLTAELKVYLEGIGTENFIDFEPFNPKGNWLRWLETYNRPARPRRKDSNRIPEFVYNSLKSPSMVLWLGEASGVSTQVVRRALAAAKTAQPNLGTQSAAIRRIIPWKMINLPNCDHEREKPTNTLIPEVAGKNKAGVGSSHSFTDFCVYTIIEGKELQRLAKSGRAFHREERKPWVTAKRLFEYSLTSSTSITPRTACIWCYRNAGILRSDQPNGTAALRMSPRGS